MSTIYSIASGRQKGNELKYQELTRLRLRLSSFSGLPFLRQLSKFANFLGGKLPVFHEMRQHGLERAAEYPVEKAPAG
jgi:hypothetical protein